MRAGFRFCRGCRAAIVLLTGRISQVLLTRGYTTRGARGVLGAAPLIPGGPTWRCSRMSVAWAFRSPSWSSAPDCVDRSMWVCPPMLGEFTPVSQRGAVIAIYGAIYTLAGILAP